MLHSETTKAPRLQGRWWNLREFFDKIAKMDGYKSWADLCRWDVGDYIYNRSEYVVGLFLYWYGAVIALRVLGLPVRVLRKMSLQRIRGASAHH